MVNNELSSLKRQLNISAVVCVFSAVLFVIAMVGVVVYFQNSNTVGGVMTDEVGYYIKFGAYHKTGNALLDWLGKNAFSLSAIGLSIGLIGFSVFLSALYYLKKPSKLKKITVERKDERNRLVRLQAESLAFKVCSLLVALTVFVMAMINTFSIEIFNQSTFNILMMIFLIAMGTRLTAEYYYQNKV